MHKRHLVTLRKGITVYLDNLKRPLGLLVYMGKSIMWLLWPGYFMGSLSLLSWWSLCGKSFRRCIDHRMTKTVCREAVHRVQAFNVDTLIPVICQWNKSFNHLNIIGIVLQITRQTQSDQNYIWFCRVLFYSIRMNATLQIYVCTDFQSRLLDAAHKYLEIPATRLKRCSLALRFDTGIVLNAHLSASAPLDTPTSARPNFSLSESTSPRPPSASWCRGFEVCLRRASTVFNPSDVSLW